MKDGIPADGETTPGRGDPAAVPLCVPHTQVHTFLRSALEHVQDAVVVLLMVLLLVLSVQSLWRIGQLAFVESAPVTRVLSEVVYVLILTELYRLLVFYLREHRISVALAVEVALVSTLREVMLKGPHEFEPWRLAGLSLLLTVLGGLLAAERLMGRWRQEASETDAR